MKKRIISLLCSAALAVSTLVFPLSERISEVFSPLTVSAEGTTTISYDVTYRQTEARSMLSDINTWRKSSDAWAWNDSNSQKIYYTGLTDLVYDYELEKVAMQRAAELVVKYAHQRPDGTDCFTAYPNGYMGAGENIAYGYPDADSVYLAWREDDDDYAGQGHRRNMLGVDAPFTSIGIACVEYDGVLFWAQEFGIGALDTKAKAANDSKTTVSAVVESSYIESNKVLSFGVVNNTVMYLGDEKELPRVYDTIQNASMIHFVGYPVEGVKTPVTPVWSVESGDSAVISGGKIKAVKDGTTVLKAAYNGMSITYTVKVTHQHVYTGNFTVVQYPTCTELGIGEEACTICGKTIRYNLTAYGHSPYGYSARKATCTSNGSIAYWYCPRCQKYFSDADCHNEISYEDTIVKSTGHKYVDTVVPPTKTSQGYTIHKCSVCQDEYTDSYVDPLKDELTLSVELKTSYADQANAVVSLSVDGSAAISSDDKSFSINAPADGTHTLTFSAPNYVSRSYTVTVNNGSIVEDIAPELNLIGDADLNGKVDMTDITAIKRQLINVKNLSRYGKQCADTDKNGALSLLDVTRLKKHLINIDRLWS